MSTRLVITQDRGPACKHCKHPLYNHNGYGLCCEGLPAVVPGMMPKCWCLNLEKMRYSSGKCPMCLGPVPGPESYLPWKCRTCIEWGLEA